MPKNKTIKNVPEKLWKDIKILALVDSTPLSEYIIEILREGVTGRKRR